MRHSGNSSSSIDEDAEIAARSYAPNALESESIVSRLSLDFQCSRIRSGDSNGITFSASTSLTTASPSPSASRQQEAQACAQSQGSQAASLEGGTPAKSCISVRTCLASGVPQRHTDSIRRGPHPQPQPQPQPQQPATGSEWEAAGSELQQQLQVLDPAVVHADVARPLAFSTGVTPTRVNHRDDRSSPIPTSPLASSDADDIDTATDSSSPPDSQSTSNASPMGQKSSRREKLASASASASRQEEEDEDSCAAGGGGGGTRPLLRHPSQSPICQSQQVTNDPHKAKNMKPEAQARAQTPQSAQSDTRNAHGLQSSQWHEVGHGIQRRVHAISTYGTNRDRSSYPNERRTHERPLNSSEPAEYVTQPQSAAERHDARSDESDDEQREPVAAVARGAVAAGRSKEQVLRAFGFELEHEVGKGSYASVYAVRRAHERRLGAPSLLEMGERGAVKVIKRHEAPEDYVHKFLPRELDIMPRLRHPHILRTYLIWQERPSVDPRERIFMFIELADAGDLLQFIKYRKVLGEELALYYVRQMLLALAYLHANGYCHRDIKCENVLLFAGRRVAKLADFGFARSYKREALRTFCGSVAYSAPELLSATPYDPRVADVWSLGCVFYIMMFGMFPFRDERNAKLVLEHQRARRYQHAEMDADSSSIRRIPPYSGTSYNLVLSLLHPDAARRPKLDALLSNAWLSMPDPSPADLQRLLDAEPCVAPPRTQRVPQTPSVQPAPHPPSVLPLPAAATQTHTTPTATPNRPIELEMPTAIVAPLPSRTTRVLSHGTNQSANATRALLTQTPPHTQSPLVSSRTSTANSLPLAQNPILQSPFHYQVNYKQYPSTAQSTAAGQPLYRVYNGPLIVRNGNGPANEGTDGSSNDTAVTITTPPHNQSQSQAFNNNHQQQFPEFTVPSPAWLGLHSPSNVRPSYQQKQILGMCSLQLSQQRANFIANTTPLTPNGSTPQHPFHVGLTGGGPEVSGQACGSDARCQSRGLQSHRSLRVEQPTLPPSLDARQQQQYQLLRGRGYNSTASLGGAGTPPRQLLPDHFQRENSVAYIAGTVGGNQQRQVQVPGAGLVAGQLYYQQQIARASPLHPTSPNAIVTPNSSLNSTPNASTSCSSPNASPMPSAASSASSAGNASNANALLLRTPGGAVVPRVP